jgi:uncharacterized YigZ family protein
MKDEYLSLSGKNEFEYKDRGSRFIAIAFPCSSISDFKMELENIKRELPGATHYCFAYRLGLKGIENRANDDGEPGGTAGLPILNQMLSAEISDVAVVVVRYYGGTKLGASGLIKAYKTATAEVLKSAEKSVKYPVIRAQIDFSYDQTKAVESTLKKFQIVIVSQTFAERCVFEIEIRRSLLTEFHSTLTTFEGITLQLS